MKIQSRLGWAFTVMMVITFLITGLACWELQRLKDRSQEIAEFHTARYGLALRWGAAIELNWQRTQAMLRSADPSYVSSLRQEAEATASLVDQWQAELEGKLDEPEGRALMGALAVAREPYRAMRVRLMKRKAAGEDVAAEVHGEIGALMMTYLGKVQGLQDYVQRTLQQAQKDAVDDADASRNLQLVAAALAALVGVGVAHGVTRAVTRPLGGEPADAVRIAQAVARGDLTERLGLQPGDGESLMAHLGAMQGSLGRIVSEVRGNAEQMALATSEIATGNSDLAARTEGQAAALEQTAAAMQSLGKAVRENTLRANQANDLAQQASHIASQGGHVVGQVVSTMKGIQASSRQIADIIGVIDGIAFQTNILALNAAVEAARAGEQGRGFAVVAAEVRSLAQRSAEAAHQIKDLITDSVNRVEQGTGLVDEAGQTMGELVGAIHRVTALMRDIGSACGEQDIHVNQVGEAVLQMEQTTQENAALVEEVARAAAALRAQADSLVRSVAVFCLNDPVYVPRPEGQPALVLASDSSKRCLVG